MAKGCQALCPWILALPRQEGLSLELTSCFVILDGLWQQRREGPGALTHLEENQIGLKGEKKKKWNLRNVQT